MSLLSFDITGGDAVKTGLAHLDAKMNDLRPFWIEEFAPRYYATVQEGFATEGHGGWAPLSPRYAQWKAKFFPGKGILERGGTLRESLSWNSGAPGPGGVFDATPLHVTVGTSVPYGKYHQRGTGKMPARPFLPTPDPRVFAPLLHAWLRRGTT